MEATMSEQAPPTDPQGDRALPGTVDASTETLDTEGHSYAKMRHADGEQAEGEDTEAHVYVEESRNDGLLPD
jgi:hypothetical protein